MLIKLFSLLFFSCVLGSCGETSTSGTVIKWTGTYPNSVYTSSGSKYIEPAFFPTAESRIQLKIFSDYQCPACISFHENVENEIWKRYIDTKKVTVTFYNYPLTMSTKNGKPLHQNSEWDALASLCALSFGKFHEFRNGMYSLEREKNGSDVTDEERSEVAKKAGITDPSFGSCLKNAVYQKSLESEIAEGDRLNLMGTPTVYMNDRIVEYSTATQLFSIIDAAIK